MTNTSATGGPLAPAAEPEPLEGQALLRFLQQLVVGITGLDPTLVRPRWQPESPNVPDAGEAWAAVGIVAKPFDTFPFVGVVGTQLSRLQRHEYLDVLTSFYDLGSGGAADRYAGLLRDGLAVPQNREVLTGAGMGLIGVGEQVTVPSLLKQRWLYRVDLMVTIARVVVRDYPVLDVLTAHGTLTAEEGVEQLELELEVNQ